MSLLARERRRLRRKFIEKVSARSYRTLDRWWDWELAKTATPLLPGTLLRMHDGNSEFALWLIGAGFLIMILWGLFVFAEIMTVYSRFSDKQYMLVTRKQLSHEYRS